MPRPVRNRPYADSAARKGPALVGAVALASLLGAASPAATQGVPLVDYQRSPADVGTWDAIVSIRDSRGRASTTTGVEINTIGCGGSCVLTSVRGGLTLATLDLGTRPWWDGAGTSAATGLATPFYQTGMTQVSTLSGDSPAPVNLQSFSLPLPMAPAAGVAGVPASRVSHEYPADGRRTVTFYRTDAKGREIVHIRITYTRRR